MRLSWNEIRVRASVFSEKWADAAHENRKTGNSLYGEDFSNDMNSTGLVHDIEADKIYNLEVQLDIGVSFEASKCTAYIDELGISRILEVMKLSRLGDKIHFTKHRHQNYMACSRDISKNNSFSYKVYMQSHKICLLDYCKLSRILWGVRL